MRKGTPEQQEDKEITSSLVNGLINIETHEDIKLSSFIVFRNRLKEDKVFRKKFIIFVFICYSFLVHGFNIGQFGPTLLDLQKITGCSLDQASFFFNAHTLGYLSSSIVVGVSFERFNKLLQMFVSILMLSVVAAVIPWCSVYEVMVTIHFLKGFFLGIIDAVGNALLLYLLALEVKTYMQILHFMFAFGGILSPLISAPFLSNQDSNNNTDQNSKMVSATMLNGTEYAIVSTDQVLKINSFETTQQNIFIFTRAETNNTMGITEESEVYKAYITSSVLTLSSAVSFLMLYCRSDEATCPTSENKTDEQKSEKISIRLRISGLVILCLIIAAYTAMEDTYAGFLVTFTVKHLNWSKAQGAFATSVFWTAFAVGRFFGIFVVNLIGQVKLLCGYSLTIIAAFICLLVTSLHHIGEGIWATSVIVGFGMSIFFPIFFSWTEEKFFHVDGKVTSLIMACASIGVIINPIILARVMDTSPVWFGYMLLAESGVLVIFFSIAVYIARLVKRERLKSGQDQVITVDAETVDHHIHIHSSSL